MDKKKLDFNVLDDPDTVSEMFVPDEQEKERIFRESRRKYQINENGSEAAVPDVSEDTVSGVEEYKRPVWHRYAQVAAAALLLTAGIGGTVCILRNKETVPDETVSFSAELPSETKTENIRTEVVSEAVSIEMMDRRFYNIGETCEYDGFEYCVKDIAVTKSSDGMTFRQNDYFPCDEDGVFICDYSYLIADITIKNTENTERQFYTNSSMACCYNYNADRSYNETFPAYGANVYNFNGEKSILNADFFAVDFQPGESKDFRIGYKVEDSELDSVFDLLCIELTGRSYAEDNRYCIIGENTSLSKFKAEDEVESTVPEPDTTEAAEEENTTEEAPKTEKAPDKRESTTEAAVTTAAPPVVTTPAATTQPVGEPPEVDWAVEVNGDILHDVLNGLSYSPDVYGGDPQYSFSARGTVFYINLSEGWIRRDNGSSQQEARLTSRAIKWINEYMAKYGLAEA